MLLFPQIDENERAKLKIEQALLKDLGELIDFDTCTVFSNSILYHISSPFIK